MTEIHFMSMRAELWAKANTYRHATETKLANTPQRPLMCFWVTCPISYFLFSHYKGMWSIAARLGGQVCDMRMKQELPVIPTADELADEFLSQVTPLAP
ncbi:hypothetical protein EVAR_12337_1 [Eumeta japonica]|uniref:Uncharacterized protein n=1 Tax=Eumeta variegata TaxID=151549 RepID=A0A4C1X2S6_EUMVA|nr:hypothetical protein EVAR_12337_1 [Eumeta japonica]